MAGFLTLFVARTFGLSLLLLNLLLQAAADPVKKIGGDSPNWFIPASDGGAALPTKTVEDSFFAEIASTSIPRPLKTPTSLKPLFSALVAAAALLAITSVVMECFRVIQNTNESHFIWRKLGDVSNITCDPTVPLTVTVPTVPTVPAVLERSARSASERSKRSKRSARSARSKRSAESPEESARREGKKLEALSRSFTRTQLEYLEQFENGRYNDWWWGRDPWGTDFWDRYMAKLNWKLRWEYLVKPPGDFFMSIDHVAPGYKALRPEVAIQAQYDLIAYEAAKLGRKHLFDLRDDLFERGHNLKHLKHLFDNGHLKKHLSALDTLKSMILKTQAWSEKELKSMILKHHTKAWKDAWSEKEWEVKLKNNRDISNKLRDKDSIKNKLIDILETLNKLIDILETLKKK